MDDAYAEAAFTVERLREALDALVVRGLRACGPDQLAQLGAHRDALARMGAAHLADALGALIEHVRAGKREAAKSLLRAKASLRVFERLLTQRAALDALAQV